MVLTCYNNYFKKNPVADSPLTVIAVIKLYNLFFRPLAAVSRYRDPQFQVGK